MARVPIAPLAIWAKAETRRRVAALVLAGVLAGLAAGLTIAAVDGARRTASAYQRMHSAQFGADALFFPSQVRADGIDVTKLDEIPEVAAWAGFALTAGVLDGFPPEITPMVTVGDGWFDSIERPLVLEGRMLDPTREDEAVLTSPLLHDADGLGVGSTLTWRNLSPQQADEFAGGLPEGFDFRTQSQGPVTTLKIVGIVRLPMDPVVSFASTGLLFTSPAWAQAHRDDTSWLFTNAFVRFRDGSSANTAFEQHIASLYGRPDLPVKRLTDDVKRIEGSLDVERTALLLFAAAVAVAGLVIVAQTLSRSARSASESVPVLSAIGVPPSSITVGVLLPFAVTIAVALGTALLSAFVLSARFPIGLARQLDPSRGYHVDWSLLALGLAVTAVVLVAACVATSALAVRREISIRRRPPRTRTVQVTKAGFSVPSAIGLSLAVERGGRGQSTVRPALFAAAIGVLGVVGARAVVSGIDDASEHKERVGAVWDAVVTTDDNVPDDVALAQANAAPGVNAIAVLSRFPTQVGGVDAPTYALDEKRGRLDFVLLSGHAPAPGEAAIAPRTASRLDVGIGDTVEVGPHRRPVVITGTTLLIQTPHSAFDEGLWLSNTDFDAVIADAGGPEFEQVGLVKLNPNASLAEFMASVPNFNVEPPTPPADILNLTKVRRLPYALAAFLVLLAVGAIAHSLLSGSRRRSHELAVLQAVGLTPRQTAACVGWQAAVIAAVALVIGIPVGLLAGQAVWRLVTDSVSIVYRPPFEGALLLALVPAVLAVVAVLAVWPARAAARLRTSELLRSE